MKTGSLAEAQLLAKLGHLRYYISTDYESSNRTLAKALAIARREQDLALQMRIHAYWSSIETMCFHSEQAFKRGMAALELARLAADLRAETIALWTTSTSLRRIGKSSEATQYIQLFLGAAERLRNRGFLVRACNLNAVHAYDRARWLEARKLGDREISLRPNPLASVFRAALEQETGNFDQAASYMREAIDRAKKVGILSRGTGGTAYVSIYIAFYALKSDTGRLLQVAEEFASETLSGVSPWVESTYNALCARGLVAVMRGDGKAALEHYKLLEPYKIEGVSQRRQLQLGLLMRTAGQMDRGVEHLRDSLVQSRRENLALYIGWNSFFLAETLMLRKGQGDAKEAHELLDDTLALSRKTGMVLLEQRIETLQSNTIRDRKSDRYPDGLTNREVEVLRLVARGMTNKKIGSELYISVKTVNNHVTNILEKISAANRAEASVYATKHGLIDA